MNNSTSQLKHKLIIDNTSKATIINFVLSGLMYYQSGELLGGFSLTIENVIKTGEKKEVDIDLIKIFRVDNSKLKEAERKIINKFEILLLTATRVCIIEKGISGSKCWYLPASSVVNLHPPVMKNNISASIKGRMEANSNTHQCLFLNHSGNNAQNCNACKACIDYAYECRNKKSNANCRTPGCVKYACICSEKICNYICDYLDN